MGGLTAHAPPTWLEDLGTADTSWIFDATGLVRNVRIQGHFRSYSTGIAAWSFVQSASPTLSPPTMGECSLCSMVPPLSNEEQAARQ
jgi:hypothetical protein